MVLEGRFTTEISIFTGYDTLPVWKEQREKFISQYHILQRYAHGMEKNRYE